MRRVGGLALILLLGCSWTTVKGPAQGSECTRSRVAPGVDTGAAVLFGLTTVAMGIVLLNLDGGEDSGLGDEARPGVALVGLAAAGLAVGFGLSARSGYRKTGACRELRVAPLKG